MSFKDEINNLKETFQQTKEQGAKLGEKYSEEGKKVGFSDQTNRRAVHRSGKTRRKRRPLGVGVQHQSDNVGLAGAGQQSAIKAAVLQIFARRVDGHRRPFNRLGFLIMERFAAQALGQRGFAALAGADQHQTFHRATSGLLSR